MKRADVVEAAEAIKTLDDIKALRAAIHGGKYELRLYALTEKETIENEVEIENKDLAKLILNRLVVELDTRLKKLGVDQ